MPTAKGPEDIKLLSQRFLNQSGFSSPTQDFIDTKSVKLTIIEAVTHLLYWIYKSMGDVAAGAGYQRGPK